MFSVCTKHKSNPFPACWFLELVRLTHPTSFYFTFRSWQWCSNMVSSLLVCWGIYTNHKSWGSSHGSLYPTSRFLLMKRKEKRWVLSRMFTIHHPIEGGSKWCFFCLSCFFLLCKGGDSSETRGKGNPKIFGKELTTKSRENWIGSSFAMGFLDSAYDTCNPSTVNFAT